MPRFNETPSADEQDLRVGPYVITAGRTRPSRTLDLASLVKAKFAAPAVILDPEHEAALALCRQGPRSVAEIAGTLHLPVQLIKILLADLLDAQALVMAMPTTSANPTDPRILEKVIAGLRTL